MKSSKYYVNPSVRCPFYKRESKYDICCSGMDVFADLCDKEDKE